MQISSLGGEMLRPQYVSNLNTAAGESTTVSIQENQKKEVVMPGNSYQEKPSDEQITEAVDKVNKVLEPVEIGIKYERHEETNRMMITVVNKENSEVIKEIPSEKMLDLAAAMCKEAGLFVDERL